jgi:hypothetical protein
MSDLKSICDENWKCRSEWGTKDDNPLHIKVDTFDVASSLFVCVHSIANHHRRVDHDIRLITGKYTFKTAEVL